MSSVMIPATVLVVVGATELDRLHKKELPTVKPVIAGFILGIGLYGIQGMDDRLARLFSILLITGTLLVKGPSIFSLTTEVLKP